MSLRFSRYPLLAGVMAFVLGCAPVSGPGAAFPEIGFEAGQKFPDLLFPALDDGRPVSLADFRGQKVLLHIFASW